MFSLFADYTIMEYRKDKRLKIFFSNAYGHSEVQTPIDSEYIYFSFEPVLNWELRRGDYKRLDGKISVWNNPNILFPSGLKVNPEERNIENLILKLRYSEVIFHKPFIFGYDDKKSESYLIDEKYWPQYDYYKTIYDEADTLFAKQEYFTAYKKFSEFVIENEEVHNYSFFDDAMTRGAKSINYYLRDVSHQMDMIELAYNNEPTKKKLLELEDLIKELKDFKIAFNNYINFSFAKDVDDLNVRYETTLYACKGFYEIINPVYAAYEMFFFSSNDYSDQIFSKYIKLLVKLLVTKDDYSFGEFLPIIDKARIQNFQQDIEQLSMLGKLTDFNNKIDVINNNIEENKYIFPETVFLNLENKSNSEPEPYFLILKAFNEYAGGNGEQFKALLEQAFKKVTDLELLFSMERWIKSYNMYSHNVETDILNKINEGCISLKSDELDKAYSDFNIASMLGSMLSVPKFQLGDVLIQQEKEIQGIMFLQQTLNLDYYYISPRIFLLNQYYISQEYDKGLMRIDEILIDKSYWIYYYYKALYLQAKNEEQQALDILKIHCESINPLSYDLFILRGDIYRKQGKDNEAIDAYNDAGLINPYNQSYIIKIEETRRKNEN